MPIKVDIDEKNKTFILGGEIDLLKNDRRVFMYLKDYLSADFSTQDIVIIPYDEANKENIMKKIFGMSAHYGFKEDYTNSIKEVMKNYFQEENNFKEFSKKALDIINNKCDRDDFLKFTQCLKIKFPNRILYPLQLLSSYHLAFAQNACNFSVPGSGKTTIVYGAYSYLKSLSVNNPKYIEKLLVIGPLSSFGPWEDEYYSCFERKITSKRLSGDIDRKEKIFYLNATRHAELTLISYQGIINIIDSIKYFLNRYKIMIVLDEAHRIKNTEGRPLAEAVLKLANYSNARVVLTGTPAPNGYEDLYNLFKFIWPNNDVLKFRLYQLNEMSKNIHDTRINKLIDNISPFFIRIKKSDLCIPDPKEHKPLKVKMDPNQREIYDYIENKYLDFFINENNRNSDLKSYLMKARITRLMQVATNPALLENPLDQHYIEQGISQKIFIDDSEIIRKIFEYKKIQIPNKFISTKSLVENIINKGEKVIVWVTFIQNIKELSKYLTSFGIKNKLLYGEIPIDNEDSLKNEETRESIIKEFHNFDSDFKVLIANPFAVSESISLHKACHNAIYVERTFNAANYIQSKDRIHRYGLNKDDVINYYFILSQDSIDEVIHERLKFKEARMNKIIESKPIPLFLNAEEEYGDEDIKAIIQNYVSRYKKN